MDASDLRKLKNLVHQISSILHDIENREHEHEQEDEYEDEVSVAAAARPAPVPVTDAASKISSMSIPTAPQLSRSASVASQPYTPTVMPRNSVKAAFDWTENASRSSRLSSASSRQ